MWMTFSTFDEMVERICSDCLAGNEDCAPFSKECPFSGDFEDLEKMCKKVDDLASSIAEDARNYDPEMYRLAAENI